MSSLRVVQPLLRASPRFAARNVAGSARRFLNTDTAPILYTAHATAMGGRSGHVAGDEGFKADLAPPKALSGKDSGGKTNPEELFAAGYGACFQNAMLAVAPSLGIKMGESVLDTNVHLVGSMKELDLGLRVDMTIKVKGMKKEDVEKVVEKTKTVCPYSRATKGNVSTNVEIQVS